MVRPRSGPSRAPGSSPQAPQPACRPFAQLMPTPSSGLLFDDVEFHSHGRQEASLILPSPFAHTQGSPSDFQTQKPQGCQDPGLQMFWVEGGLSPTSAWASPVEPLGTRVVVFSGKRVPPLASCDTECLAQCWLGLTLVAWFGDPKGRAQAASLHSPHTRQLESAGWPCQGAGLLTWLCWALGPGTDTHRPGGVSCPSTQVFPELPEVGG